MHLGVYLGQRSKDAEKQEKEEKQKSREAEKQNSGEAEKQRSTKAEKEGNAEKQRRRKVKKQGTRNPKRMPKTKKNHQKYQSFLTWYFFVGFSPEIFGFTTCLAVGKDWIIDMFDHF